MYTEFVKKIIGTMNMNEHTHAFANSITTQVAITKKHFNRTNANGQIDGQYRIWSATLKKLH